LKRYERVPKYRGREDSGLDQQNSKRREKGEEVVKAMF